MSNFQALQAIREVRELELSTHSKLLLTVLSTYADKDGECFPSVVTLAADCSMSRRGVQKKLRELAEAGLITQFTGGAGPKDPNRYRLHFGRLEEGEPHSPSEADKGEPHSPLRPLRANHVPNKGEPHSPELVIELENRNSLFPEGESDPFSEEEGQFLAKVKTTCLGFEVEPEELLSRIQRKGSNRVRDLEKVTKADVYLWLFWLRETGLTLSGRMLTNRRLRRIQERRSVSSREAIEKVVRHVCHGQDSYVRFLRGEENPERQALPLHHDLNGWFRDDEKFQRVLELAGRASDNTSISEIEAMGGFVGGGS